MKCNTYKNATQLKAQELCLIRNRSKIFFSQ